MPNKQYTEFDLRDGPIMVCPGKHCLEVKRWMQCKIKDSKAYCPRCHLPMREYDASDPASHANAQK